MRRPSKFTEEQLREQLGKGKTIADIAVLFGVSQSTVRRQTNRLGLVAVPQTPRSTEVVDSVFETRTALEMNYRGCLQLLEDPKVNVLAVRALLLKHIQQGLKILEKWYPLFEQPAFQEEVLAILEECEPGSRARIIARLRERQAVRGVVIEHRGALASGRDNSRT